VGKKKLTGLNNTGIDRRIEVYDIETILGCFTYTGINVDTRKVTQFVISGDTNQLRELIDHLDTLKYQIGFNNIGFDYPVLHCAYELLLKGYDRASGTVVAQMLYGKAQEIIGTQDRGMPTIRVKDYKIRQLDLFKMWHFNNKARRTSLKALEIAMNFPNVVEMPIDHHTAVLSEDQVKEVLSYNLNDVLATEEFFKRSKDKIQLRKDLTGAYNIPCINFSDSRIGEQLMLKLYCEKSGKDYWTVKEMRTHRSQIALSECIFDYIKFESKEFNGLLEKLKKSVVFETKGALEESIIYKGFRYDYGLGGIHGCIKPGIYESDDDHIIIDADVGS
jgi:hypothetical protein